ncbi:MAG: hypothetical protein A2289_16490 [Deltaproteobacteria bacterium RIFOXYA12_FULL_58_15]|nr:MAG: hypothetical protein A2289_16490 [Deltaproteobacteria bacterium RIFOXYA12_FULL_58_15]OGR09080.1 MAG: hypothetical protein A2341_26020 [Deltaproteobacteria bacterium RIFOXYB12_FULL_58_9]
MRLRISPREKPKTRIPLLMVAVTAMVGATLVTVFAIGLPDLGDDISVTAQDIGSLGGNTTFAWSVNEFGVVVGYGDTASGQTVGFQWTADSGLVELPVLDGGTALAFAINNLGQIVGSATTATGVTHAVMWSPAGDIVDLGTWGAASALATGINDRGQVVGAAIDVAGTWRAVLWSQEGGVQLLGSLGGNNTMAADINNNGQIVGYGVTANRQWHGFLWADGEMIDLGTMGGSASFAAEINDDGMIAGSRLTANGMMQPATWQIDLSDGSLSAGALEATDGNSALYGVSSQGMYVGSGLVYAASFDAFRFELSPPVKLLPTPGGSYCDVESVNGVGQIAGWSSTSEGALHATLWRLSLETSVAASSQLDVLVNLVAMLADTGEIEAQALNPLSSKLQSSQAAVERDNLTAAINKLGAFQNDVGAQAGKKITQSAADALIAAAASIIATLEAAP